MSKYIELDALVAEIERRLEELSQLEKASYEIGLYDAYKIVLSFLDTLEVKEVDLDKEICKALIDLRAKDSMRDWFTHFFELGLKAQKGEEV